MSWSTPSPSPGSIAADFASLKRKYNALEAQVVASQALEPAKQSIKATHINSGRAVRRIVDMFASISDLVAEHSRRLECEISEEPIESTKEQEQAFRSYNLLIKALPIVQTLSDSSDMAALQALYTNLRSGADNARADDAGKLKTAVVLWINERHGPSTPALRGNSKDERGLRNIHTGRLLRPVLYDCIRAMIRDGSSEYPVTAQDWPAFCYAGNQCDPQDLEKGLFRGPMLVMAFKFLFISPSSVSTTASDADTTDSDTPPAAKRQNLNGKKYNSTRTNVATLVGLKSVTPRAIAYLAVQLRFALSSASAWKTEDSQFDNMEFYYAIVNYFEETLGPVAAKRGRELLGWWNIQIFGRSSGLPQPPGPRVGSSASIMEAQMRAREAAVNV